MERVEKGWRLARVMAVVSGAGVVLVPLTVIVLWATLDERALAHGAGFSLQIDPDAGAIAEGARLMSVRARIVAGAVSTVLSIPLVIRYGIDTAVLADGGSQDLLQLAIIAFAAVITINFIEDNTV